MGGRGGRRHTLGMVRRRVVPDEQFRDVWAYLAEPLEQDDAVVLTAALTQHLYQFARLYLQGAMNDAPPIAPADHDGVLLAALGPTGTQRRELAQRRFIAEPDFPAARQGLARLLNQRPFLAA